MNWDLNHLFNSIQEVDELLDTTLLRAREFHFKYKRCLDKVEITKFDEVVGEFENIQESIGKAMTYIYLIFSTDSSKGDLLAKYQKFCSDIEEELIFFELEFNKLDEIVHKEITKKSKKYSFFLENIAKDKPYQLSDKEEKILLKKDLTSSSACFLKYIPLAIASLIASPAVNTFPALPLTPSVPKSFIKSLCFNNFYLIPN